MAGSTVIVLLAAGEGRRFGSIKQLADIDGEPMVRRSARNAVDSGLPVIVVTGAEAERVEGALTGLPLRVARNEAWAEGMGRSLAAGIGELRRSYPQATGALVCLADQPVIGQALFEAMFARHRVAGDRILASEHAGVTGPPVLFPRDCFEALTDWSGALGAHALLERESARVERFSDLEGIDVDTPEDLQRVRTALGLPPRQTSV